MIGSTSKVAKSTRGRNGSGLERESLDVVAGEESGVGQRYSIRRPPELAGCAKGVGDVIRRSFVRISSLVPAHPSVSLTRP